MKSSMCETAADAGFSVLEALVAIAILAAALLPLLELQSQFTRTAATIERTEQRITLEDMALAHISALNIDQTQEGSIMTPQGQIIWTAKPAVESRYARDNSGGRARYLMTLYDVEVILRLKSGAQEQLTLQALGWHPTQSVLSGF